MKWNLWVVKAVAPALILAGAAAEAGPLRRADVAAEPGWLVHVDCDVLRSTAIGRYILDEMEKPQAKAKLAAFEAISSLDLRTQIHGLTLYSIGSTPQDGVLLVYADFDSNRLVTLARAANDAQETTYKDHTIYSWVDGKKHSGSGSKKRTYAALSGKCIIFGQREQRVAQALDVFSAASQNLGSTHTFPQLGTPGSISFVQAAARKMDFAASDPNAAILRLSKLVRFQLSEAQNQVSAVLTLEANDEEVASNMSSIAQGLVALMKLQKEKPESVKIAEALTLKQEGPSLVLSLALPANDVVEMMKSGAAKKAQKKNAKENQE